jgi:hypothetical protein
VWWRDRSYAHGKGRLSMPIRTPRVCPHLCAVPMSGGGNWATGSVQVPGVLQGYELHAWSFCRGQDAGDDEPRGARRGRALKGRRVLFNHAVTIQSAARALIALSLHSRRRRDHEDRKNISSCTFFLQAIVRRSRVRLQYIRMLGIVRATPGYQNFSLTKPTSQIVTAVVSSPSHTASTKASIKPTWQDLGLGDTESETGGEIEGSMTARSHLSGSSDTEPPFIGSEDESRMREGLLSMGIGEQAVGHVMWVAVSVGGMPSSSKLTLKGGDSDTALCYTLDRDPPAVDGLVPLRAGRVQWAG